MLKRYATLFFLSFAVIIDLQSQIVSIDSVINTDNEITLVYSISDSLTDFSYQIDAYGIFGTDTILLDKARGYPTDSLQTGTYRMRWDAVSELGRFRGSARFVITASPGFRVIKGPAPSYKVGQEVKLAWYGGNADDEQFLMQLMQGGEVIAEEELQFGVMSTSYLLAENLKVGEGYSLRLSGSSTGTTWETSPFNITKVKEKKWYIYAIPAGIVTGILTYLLLSGPIDPPEDLPEDG